MSSAILAGRIMSRKRYRELAAGAADIFAFPIKPVDPRKIHQRMIPFLLRGAFPPAKR